VHLVIGGYLGLGELQLMTAKWDYPTRIELGKCPARTKDSDAEAVQPTQRGDRKSYGGWEMGNWVSLKPVTVTKCAGSGTLSLSLCFAFSLSVAFSVPVRLREKLYT